MTPGQWTKRLPHVAGWYWFKGDTFTPRYMASGVPCIVRVTADMLFIHRPLVVRFPQGTMAVEEMGGVWCGPLPEPIDGE